MMDLRVHPLESLIWSDERGWGVRPLEAAGLAGQALGDLHVVSLEPGKVRGNHHHNGSEWLLLTEGTIEVRSRASEDEEVRLQVLSGGRPFLLEIPAGVHHSFKNVGDRTVYLIAFSDMRRMSTTKSPLG